MRKKKYITWLRKHLAYGDEHLVHGLENKEKIEKLWRRVLRALFRPKNYYRLCRLFPKDPIAKMIVTDWRYGKLLRENLTDVFPGIENVDITLNKPFLRYAEVSYGMPMLLEEICAICAIIKFLKPKNILEIGTFIGDTTVNMAMNTDAKIITIDLASVLSRRSLFPKPRDKEYEREIGYRFKNSKCNIEQVYADSTKIDWKTLNPPFDIVFIDGEHRYDYVKQDTMNALKYAKVIIWHDYVNFKDIARVVEECPVETHLIKGTRLAIGFVDKGQSRKVEGL